MFKIFKGLFTQFLSRIQGPIHTNVQDIQGPIHANVQDIPGPIHTNIQDIQGPIHTSLAKALFEGSTMHSARYPCVVITTQTQ